MDSKLSIITVSQLNKQVKMFLEHDFGGVHVEGEISNLSKPSSGHYYFTLKDSSAQIRCAYFKNRQTNSIRNTFSDGQHVVASGKLSLYEARGEYQLIVEEIIEAGLGALYQQFEELKNKLATEGLFNPERKRALPKFPESIGIITSPSGAAIRDILSTLARRYAVAKIIIYPSEVQGQTASQQLINAINLANNENRCQVLILARGGGSIEDLWAFNNEHLARAIVSSKIPIVSGVGHETDFTIADFVADYRAETPTAAAAVVTPDCIDLFSRLEAFESRLHKAILRVHQALKLKINHLVDKITSPKQAIGSHWQTLDYLEKQLLFAIQNNLNQKHHLLHIYSTKLHGYNPITNIDQAQLKLRQLLVQLLQEIKRKLNESRQRLITSLSTLHVVSPLATLDRGYAIVKKEDGILFSSKQVHVGDALDITLSKGQLTCEVTQIKD
jgi:exodeoxyribonuclease VII large subunit